MDIPKVVDEFKPANIDEFKKWYEKMFEVKIDRSMLNYYESVTHKMKLQISESHFWTGFLKEIKEISDEYLIDTEYEFTSNAASQPELLIKPFDSFLDKLYRKNVINNDNWPECPDSGWYSIDKSFSRINDIIRTSLIVKYLDGVELCANRLYEFGKSHGNTVVVSMEAREHGYYAAHLDVLFELEIPRRIDWDTEVIICSVEIQVTTQLQEVLKKLTHTYYETRRLNLETNDNKKWQWNYKSEEFTANYLGHILHYLEGMILEVRDRRGKNGRV